MNLEIKHRAEEERHYLFIDGEIDVYTAEKLKNALVPLTEIKGSEVIVDLSNVNYIDSTGLGIFIGALKSTNKYESHFKLTGMIERVRKLFQITGLDEVIDIEESAREEAK